MSWILTSIAVVIGLFVAIALYAVFIVVRTPSPPADEQEAPQPRTRPGPDSVHRRPSS